MVRVASGKYAISTAPTTASNSSSASSRLSWQPSQDGNLKTAILGLPFFFSELILVHHRADLLVGKHRSVLADEMRAVLAVAAEADRTLHVSFHGEVNLTAAEAVTCQVAGHKAHHDLGPAEHGHGLRRTEPRVLEQSRHHADVVAPAQAAIVHRDEHLRVALARPRCQLLAIEKVARAACAVDQHQPVVVCPMRQDVINYRPQGRKSDAASHNHQVMAACDVHRPADPERATHTNAGAGFLADERVSGLTDGPHGVNQPILLPGIAADRDRQFAYPVNPQHAELPRLKETRPSPVFRLERQREG